MIEFKDVSTIYDNDESIEILNGVNLHIKDGEFVSIIGPAGAGKSTLLRLLTREISPHRGEVILDGVNLAEVPSKAIPLLRRKIGTVYQDFKLLSAKTAFENVAFAMEVCGADRGEIESDVPKILGIVGLGDKLKSFPHQLSGGEKQRLAIARALIHRPRIILADEPTGNLDLVNSYDVVKLLMKINELGTTVILATHNREVVNAIGKRVISIEKGKIVRDQVENGKYVI
ncbi:MAG: cell division ATP-binding protein FtsE [Candidatus Yanofskybacteria bacterium RIFCSPLOWO2_02_FULL_43_10]|uniref:Cell division ATP-binding protein FtsE n=1 Tax=Candidatus Yanofskybacteria bacterium RIFCSPLOWO2_12_FULL_43_11b TaxID=1802710 RepID=A0A1F8H719_9BACT|nr:MAG: cell division ATP-binding protein FtsE [Candidatus Yanofskybacteria bacterium RIFCSPHIGHO2_01_FULL_43_32]OGN11547.1 MAG: cell division ATP-binding protein FtsE [Candidatus Yanofskybacteria bacterium RIFCSPHIGHO2_02_FULL_43_12]OGN17432.1 MAG: cell division ATP-binding protein FtsE [Candidatus Yanofskybacteria bacterium RIFCSPHIGHO2_12_FULL_43_11]OGN24884.1 MAG: cell division ATP-binding protein FtsE [Candidatus Yanofskybacteria bacterium RIFCSPLOWO2_01_FULL_43_46]OGN30266.1 MAG: cell div